jgi:hypothetical protein
MMESIISLGWKSNGESGRPLVIQQESRSYKVPIVGVRHALSLQYSVLLGPIPGKS